MDIVKRLLPCIHISKRKTNQRQSRCSSLEHLFNEIFYEIFDYLDGYEIYHAFSNLNYRFEQLLRSSFLLLKMKFYFNSNLTNMHIYQQLLLHHQHQLFSLNLRLTLLDHPFRSSFTFNLSFNRLESLVLEEIPSDTLSSMLISLSSLPRLYSLSMNCMRTSEDINHIYRLIFNLPTLKCNRLCTSSLNRSVSLPMTFNDRSKTIEYLVINHFCTFNDICSIISHLPQLHRLKCSQIEKNETSSNTISTMKLPNLTNLCLQIWNVSFDEFELFMIQMNCPLLKVLRIDVFLQDNAYFDAQQWKQLISQYFPQLDKFYLYYSDYCDDKDQYPVYTRRRNAFSSSFWIERQWVCDVSVSYASVTYFLQPYKKRWYDVDESGLSSSSVELSKSNRLTYQDSDADGCRRSILVDIKHVLTVLSIYHLEFREETTVVSRLMELMDVLPDIQTLKVHCLSTFWRERLWNEKRALLSSIKSASQITKVSLTNMNDIDEFICLLVLCPRLTYFKVVECLDRLEIEDILEEILTKIKRERHRYLRCLCFKIPAANDGTMKKLKTMIDSKQLLVDYSMYRVIDDINLRWK